MKNIIAVICILLFTVIQSPAKTVIYKSDASPSLNVKSYQIHLRKITVLTVNGNLLLEVA